MREKPQPLIHRPTMLVLIVALSVIATVMFAGCKTGTRTATNDAARQEETGVEKVKPAAGTGNVQGKVMFNSKPAENIEVKLCEKFSRYVSGCGGQTYTARTDKDGEFVITNVPPKTYEALTARVFESDEYVFATTGLAGISSAKYDVTADKTFFVTPIHLFKSDLKTVNPKAGSKVSAEGLTLKWDEYPDASYYKFSTYSDDVATTSPYVNERVEGTSFEVSKPMPKGTYRFQVTAFNKDDRKLAQSSSDVKFTVQ
ncbi:MAG TPA: hypothetical protein VJT71_20150 [Pyrinomonadaceae bacterium]|nr:hypothetical protein [Pyrinomonadaceae bacterium]